MSDPFPHVVVDGEPRYLACLPPRPDFGGFRLFASANRIIPRSQWRPVDLSPLAGDVWDQGQHGSCVGHGSGKAFEIVYRMGGGAVPPGGFSPTSLYAQINGGRDGGAIVSDAMDALIGTGIGLMSDVPESVIYDRQISAAAKAKYSRFRVSDAFHCATFDSIGSALQLGYPVSFGITIYSGFNQVGSDGMVPTGGVPIGGHCMAVEGCVPIGGQWYFAVRNSWGPRWGKAGICYLSEWHFARDGQLDAFAIRADQFDPQDANPAPPYIA